MLSRMSMRRRAAWAVLGLVGLAALALLSGCVGRGEPPAGGCVPRIMIEPAEVSAGETISITSDTACDDAAPSGGWVVGAGHIPGGEPLVSVVTDEQFDGSFELSLTLPADFPEGEAWAGVQNWDYSFCAANASCAAATGDFTVTP